MTIAGSTVALTDGNGNVTDRIEYSTYGSITYRTNYLTTPTDTPFLFNGRYGVMTFDPNGLLSCGRVITTLICADS